jgi:hypothetical protein
MLNAVLSALPTYYMSVFRLSSWVINSIDKIRRDFFWHGSQLENMKIHLINWVSLCMPKSIGGLGIVDLHVFNQVMLTIWLWKWAKKENSLWNEVNWALNIRRREWDSAPNLQLWRDLKEIGLAFENRITYQIKSGKEVCF